MSDFADDIQTANIPSYNDGSEGDGLLRMQWRNGVAMMKTAGRFFVSEERLGDRPIAAPWTSGVEVFESGDEATGYIAPQLRVAVIGVRQQPFYRDGDSDRKIWLDRWAAGRERQSMQVEVLCFVQGLADTADAAPIVWTSATLKTSFAIIGNKEPSINLALKSLLKAARVFSGREMPTWAFWLPIANIRTAKGTPDYIATKGKPVTPPTTYIPSGELTREHLNKLYVGKDLLSYGAELREEWSEWLKERRTNDDGTEVPVEPHHPAQQGRNQPQPITDDTLPF
jgi:hypothetical protein